MQFVLFLVALFIVLCGLYGIYAGIAAMLRAAARLAASPRRAPPESIEPRPAQREEPCGKSLNEGLAQADPNAITACLEELKTLHALLKSGALTPEEFAELKRHILETLTTPDPMRETT